MRNQAGRTSPDWYDVGRKVCLSSFIGYEESSRLDFVRSVRSHAKGGLDLVHPVRGIMHMRLRSSSTKSFKRRACPRPSVTWNQIGSTSSILYEKTTKRDYVRPLRSCVKGEPVLIRLLRGIKHAGLCPSGTKSCKRKACPLTSVTRNQAGGTTSVWYEVVR